MTTGLSFGQRMLKARTDAGIDRHRAVYLVQDLIGRKGNPEILRQMEAGTYTVHQAVRNQPLFLLGLCVVYKVSPEWLLGRKAALDLQHAILTLAAHFTAHPVAESPTEPTTNPTTNPTTELTATQATHKRGARVQT